MLWQHIQTLTEGYLGVSARELAFANMHKIPSVDRERKREGDKDVICVTGVDFPRIRPSVDFCLRVWSVGVWGSNHTNYSMCVSLCVCVL